MKGLQSNGFPGGIGPIQSLIPPSKRCRGFAVGFCSIEGLFASVSDPTLCIHSLDVGEQGMPQGVNSCLAFEELLTLT